MTATSALASLTGRLFASVSEAAAILDYDHRTIRAAIATGDIPAIRCGRNYRIPVSWLREFAGLAASGDDAA